MAQPENVTDISDRGWSDFQGVDREILQELAVERVGIDARQSNEALVAALLAADGRVEDVPEAQREEHADAIAAAADASDEADTDAADEADEDEAAAAAPAEPDPAGGSFFVDAEPLQAWLDHVSTLVKEARVTLKEDGWYTRAVDAANVGMVEATLDYDAFESYQLDGEALIGVNISRVIDVVGAANAGDLIHVELDAETRNLVFSWNGHEFTLSLIVPDSIRQRPDLPDLDLPATVEFEAASDFKNAITYSNQLSDNVRLATDRDTFIVRAEGDVDTYEGRFADGEEVAFLSTGDARSRYSLDYLTDIASAWASDHTLTVYLGEAFPVEIRATIWAGDYEAGDVTYMLAPRIDSD